MRATTHFARTTKGGKAFSSKHNDRNYSEELKPDNVIAEKSKDNAYHFCWFEGEPKDEIKTFEDHEKWVYQNFLGRFFDDQNERNKKSRHLERVKTVEQFRKMARYCPEEVLWYVGKKGDTATAEQLEEMAANQIAWEEYKYPGLKYLDWAVHVDELGAPHVQARRIWTYDKNGVVAVGQNKALEQMGVNLPNPEEPISETNNRKMTYTKETRTVWIHQAEKLGYNINREPKKNNGQTLSEWQVDQDIKKRQAEIARELNERVALVVAREERVRADEKELLKKEADISKREKALSDAEKALSERVFNVDQEISRVNAEMDQCRATQQEVIFAHNFQIRANKTVLEMIANKSYTERSDSRQLFGGLKTLAKGFVELKQKAQKVLLAPLSKVEEWCRKAREKGCSNLEEYLFPAPTKEIEQVREIKNNKPIFIRRGR